MPNDNSPLMPSIVPAFQGLHLDIDRDGAERAGRALEELFATYPPGPMGCSIMMGEHGFLELRRFGSRIMLAGIYILPESRSAGHGQRYLAELLRVADKHGAEIQCVVEPFGRKEGGKRLGVAQLTAWYKRAGFAAVPGQLRTLRRLPVTSAALDARPVDSSPKRARAKP